MVRRYMRYFDESINVLANDRGIFLSRSNKLTVGGIRHLRARCQSSLQHYRNELLSYQQSINYYNEQIEKFETLLKELNSPVVEAYINKIEEEKRQIMVKAEQVLRDVVGEELYSKLAKGKPVTFESDNRKFKLHKSGKVYEWRQNSWQHFCILRPSDLPLPDYVATVFLNVKNRANELHRR